MNINNIIIRADANKNIGMGHIMRCLSIADALNSNECNVEFAIADDSIQDLINFRGYRATVLNTDYRQMESEIPLWSQLKADIVIVDSYYVTERYLLTLRQSVNNNGGKLIYIDDIYSFPYPVDILINYNAYATKELYDILYAGVINRPNYILGPIYAPLRSMFRNINKRAQSKNVNNVLVSTGGSDSLHISLALVKKLSNDVGIRGKYVYHILLGAMNSDKDEIYQYTESESHIILHENVSDMRSLIQSCDIVVSAAGSTLYEICACGIPLITYSVADNQILGAEAFENFGLAINIGDLRRPDSIKHDAIMSGELRLAAVDRLIETIDDLSENYDMRVKMGNAMQSLIDGCGAERLVKAILRECN